MLFEKRNSKLSLPLGTRIDSDLRCLIHSTSGTMVGTISVQIHV